MCVPPPVRFEDVLKLCSCVQSVLRGRLGTAASSCVSAWTTPPVTTWREPATAASASKASAVTRVRAHGLCTGGNVFDAASSVWFRWQIRNTITGGQDIHYLRLEYRNVQCVSVKVRIALWWTDGVTCLHNIWSIIQLGFSLYNFLKALHWRCGQGPIDMSFVTFLSILYLRNALREFIWRGHFMFTFWFILVFAP